MFAHAQRVAGLGRRDDAIVLIDELRMSGVGQAPRAGNEVVDRALIGPHHQTEGSDDLPVGVIDGHGKKRGDPVPEGMDPRCVSCSRRQRREERRLSAYVGLQARISGRRPDRDAARIEENDSADTQALRAERVVQDLLLSRRIPCCRTDQRRDSVELLESLLDVGVDGAGRGGGDAQPCVESALLGIVRDRRSQDPEEREDADQADEDERADLPTQRETGNAFSQGSDRSSCASIGSLRVHGPCSGP